MRILFLNKANAPDPANFPDRRPRSVETAPLGTRPGVERSWLAEVMRPADSARIEPIRPLRNH